MSALTRVRERPPSFQTLVNLFVENSEPSLEEAKKRAKNCIDLEIKYEKISFGSIIRENCRQQDDLVMLITAFDLLLKYATNLLKQKLPNLWKTIPVNSGIFKTRVDCMKGARDVLKLIGYSVETENALKFPDEQYEPDRDKLFEIAAEILMAKVETEEIINDPCRIQKYLQTELRPQLTHVGSQLHDFQSDKAGLMQRSISSPTAHVGSPILLPSSNTQSNSTLISSGNILLPTVSTPPPLATSQLSSATSQSLPATTQPSSGTNMPSSGYGPVPPIAKPRQNKPKVGNQMPVIEEHRKKLEDIKRRHQNLCQEPQHPVSEPVNISGEIRPHLPVTSTNGLPSVPVTTLQVATVDSSCVPVPSFTKIEKTPVTSTLEDVQKMGKELKASMALEGIRRATLEDANREVQNYRNTQVLNALPYQSASLLSSTEDPVHKDEGEKSVALRSLAPSTDLYAPQILRVGEAEKPLEKMRSTSNGVTHNDKQTYKDFKKSIKAKKDSKHEIDIPEAEPILSPIVPSGFETAQNEIKNTGFKLLKRIMELTQEGYSLEEVQCIMNCNISSLVNFKTEWNKRVETVQKWVGLETPSVGIPSRKDAVRHLSNSGGVMEKAKEECHKERFEKIMSLINKMKPFMEVKWEVAKGVLCDYDMEVEKAAWALQRDILSPLYEFINSEQEWAKVKQSDMSEIKYLLKGGGWADKKGPLHLLMGECKFEDAQRADIVLQLMKTLEQDGRDCELQFCIDAVKDHKTLDEAMKFLDVECPICIMPLLPNDMLLMPGCPHSVCKECFRGHFTDVMKTKTVKHFNCPVCSNPDMSNRDADQDMYLELFVNMITLHTSGEITDICNQKLRDHNLSKNPNFCWCASENCHTGFINETGRDKITCPTCKKEMCFKCKKPWERQHDGLTCDQFAQWKHDNDPELQQQGLAAHLEANGIECPACHYRYDLARGGCMHFKCTQCPIEFCSGCGQTFKDGQACKNFASCAKKGLHAHHPRDCLYYLRDFSVQELQGFLEKNNIPFDKDPPKALLEAAAKEAGGQAPQLRCTVMLQKDSVDGLKDEVCGMDAMNDCAGLCKTHYTEYLATKINKAHLDPISLYGVNNLQAMLSREELPPLDKAEDDNETVYKEKLIKHIQQVLPLPHVQRAGAIPTV